MFRRSETDKRRVVIVDIMHMFFKYAYGGASGLSSTIMVDGVPKRVDTTLPAYSIKQLHRWSNFGFNPLVVCFDGVGSTRSRKAYFAKYSEDSKTGSVVYKDGRDSQDARFFEGVNLTMNLLRNGGVCVLKADGYEADDLIKAAVDKAKIDYPDLPIDVITGDADLLPLVDEQVSVFLSSRKSTWAESSDIEKKNYVQIRPENIQAYVEGLTEFKGLTMPYNTVLLKKLLRGDKSDAIPAYPKFTPTKYNNLVSSLVEDGYDLGDLFRYEVPEAVISYRGTEEPIPEHLIESTPKEQKMLKFKEPKALTNMCNILSDYLDDDIIKHIRLVYNGINLNGAFVGLPDGFNRKPAVLNVEIKGYIASVLQAEVSCVQIRLPM